MDIVMDLLKLLHCRWHKLQLSKYYVSVKAKSCGLVVKADKAVGGLNPPTDETIFQAPFIWINAWNKNCGNLVLLQML
jgi:hypothetical protein